MSYPNQKMVLYMTDAVDAKRKRMVDVDAVYKAASTLGKPGIRMWLWMVCENKSGYRGWLYRGNVCRAFELTPKMYAQGVKELIDNGYLVPILDVEGVSGCDVFDNHGNRSDSDWVFIPGGIDGFEDRVSEH